MIYPLHKDKKSIYQVCLISIAEFIHAFVKPAEQQSKTSEFYCTKILYSIRNVKDRLHNKLHYKKNSGLNPNILVAFCLRPEACRSQAGTELIKEFIYD